jgi:hypothetical protein
VNPSGDIDVTNAGVFSIASGVIVNADVNAAAAIDWSKMEALTDAHILVGSGANVATDVAVTGDVTIANTGVTAIGSGKVTSTMIAADTVAAVDIATGGVASAEVLDDSLTVADHNTAMVAEATGTLTAANIAAMNATPVTLLAAPGAGKVIIIDEIEFFHDYDTAAYTDGGDVTIEYETSGLDINVFDVALVTAGADDNWLIKPLTYTSTATASSHASLTANANKAIKITNAVGAFAGGDVANIIKYRIRYHVITLLT